MTDPRNIVLKHLGVYRWRKTLARVGTGFITLLIVVNFALYVALCQWQFQPDTEDLVHRFCDYCIFVFVIEMLVRILWYPSRFFHGRDVGWNIFDLVITSASVIACIPDIVPITPTTIILFRSLRSMRLLRVLSRFSRIRALMESMFSMRTDFMWIAALLLMVMSLYAVVGCALYASAAPESFGTFSRAFFTLFQVMTYDGWATDEGRPLMETHPYCWIYFISFIIISAFIILNVVTGIIVDAMSEVSHQVSAERERKKALFERDVDFCLSDNGVLDASERQFLDRKQREYELRPSDACNILNSRLRHYRNSRTEYTTLVNTLLRHSPNIGQIDRHLLNRKQKELGIDTTFALAIETEVRGKLWPDHELNDQAREFKEFYRRLLEMKHSMQLHYGVDDKTMNQIRAQLLNEGFEE